MGKNDGDLLSNCCAWDFDPLGYEKEEGIYQERCLKCGKLCEPLYISNRDIENIRNCKVWEPNMSKVESAIVFYAFRYALGRQTYSVSEVVRYIVEHWSDLHLREQNAMKKEIEFAIWAKRAGHQMDVEEWQKILEL